MKHRININWQQLALNLRYHKPLWQVSLSLGLNRDYVGKFSRGEIQEPKFSDGIALLDLHLDLCGIEKHKKLLN